MLLRASSSKILYSVVFDSERENWYQNMRSFTTKLLLAFFSLSHSLKVLQHHFVTLLKRLSEKGQSMSCLSRLSKYRFWHYLIHLSLLLFLNKHLSKENHWPSSIRHTVRKYHYFDLKEICMKKRSQKLSGLCWKTSKNRSFRAKKVYLKFYCRCKMIEQ